MGLIIQTSPISASVISGLSAAYDYQFVAAGGVGELIYTVTDPNPAFEVSETGALITTGILLDGTYVITGDVTDFHGNFGIWMLTLSVIGGTTPGTTVTPVQAALPSPLEILVPFQIDSATGAVAQLVDYVSIIEQHVNTILQTAQGERLMNPTFGAGLGNYVFSPIDEASISALISDIQGQLTTFEPNVNLLNVTAVPDPANPNVLNVTVQFSVVPFDDVNTVTVNSGGPIYGVNL